MKRDWNLPGKRTVGEIHSRNVPKRPHASEPTPASAPTDASEPHPGIPVTPLPASGGNPKIAKANRRRRIPLGGFKAKVITGAVLAAGGVAWTQHDNYNAAVSDQRIAAANEASVVRYKGAHMKCLNRNVVVHAAEYRTEPEVVGRKVIFFFNKNNSAGNVPKGQEDLLARPYVLQDQSGGHTQDKLGFMFQEDTPPKNSKLTPAQIAARIEWLDADVTQLLTNPKTQSSRAMTGYPLMATSINTGQDYINCPIGADGQSTTADGQRAAYAIPGPAGHVESVLGAFGIPIAGTGK